jgi:DNA-binding MarR family transcriptional regulator
MSKGQRFEIRDLRNGDWYWIHKAVIQEYEQKVGAVGIVVYSFLASLADSDQRCFPSQRYIAESLGYSRSYINEVLKVLERNGLIRIERKGHHRVYYLLKVRCQLKRTQMSTIPNLNVNYTDTNDNKLTRNINNNDTVDKNFEGFKPETREELLALDIANALNDQRSLPLYLSYAKRHPEPLLRRLLGEVEEIPPEKIKKSKAALFNHLIKRYAQNHKCYGD